MLLPLQNKRVSNAEQRNEEKTVTNIELLDLNIAFGRHLLSVLHECWLVRQPHQFVYVTLCNPQLNKFLEEKCDRMNVCAASQTMLTFVQSMCSHIKQTHRASTDSLHCALIRSLSDFQSSPSSASSAQPIECTLNALLRVSLRSMMVFEKDDLCQLSHLVMTLFGSEPSNLEKVKQVCFSAAVFVESHTTLLLKDNRSLSLTTIMLFLVDFCRSFIDMSLHFANARRPGQRKRRYTIILRTVDRAISILCLAAAIERSPYNGNN